MRDLKVVYLYQILPSTVCVWGGARRRGGGPRGAVKGLKRSRYLVLLTYNSPRMGEWVGVLRHPGKCMCSQAMVRIGLMKKLKKRTLATTPGAEQPVIQAAECIPQSTVSSTQCLSCL